MVENLAVLADGERLAGGAPTKFVEGAVGLADGLVLIGDERKRQVETFGETGLDIELVGADADDLDIGTLEPRVELRKGLELYRSATCKGLGIKGEDDRSVFEQVGEGERVGSGGGGGEVGGDGTGGDASHWG